MWETIDRNRHAGLPDPAAMLSAQAVADAVLYVLTRPAETHINYLGLERS
jgi:NADP-dependent 3-hydroxy acid dehydrogenase YdfG